MKICRIPECGQKVWSKGLCRLHDTRRRRGFSEEELNLPVGYRSTFKQGWIHKGYRWITLPDGQEVMEHRHLMEQHVGRKLHYDEVVHHINENKLDNRIENLEIKPRADHTSHHRTHRPPCTICGVYDPHGTRNLCGRHQQRWLTILKRAVG